MNAILVLALFVALASCFTEHEYQSAFTNWMQEHKKAYAASEFQSRYAIFKSNMDYVENWNAAGSKTVLGLTLFADLTNEEYRKTYLGTKITVNSAAPVVEDTPVADLPASVDWRTVGAVTPIKNQGQCGGCWSFSTTGSVEGIHFLTTKSLVSLSEQNLIDCSTGYGNEGCNGGLMDDAFKYIIANKGIDTEASYPYKAENGKCHYDAANSGATISDYTDVTARSESALQAAVAQQPVSVAIDASKESFQLYKSGVYYAPMCSQTALDHGVLAVGYNTDGNDAYWIVKNSWGTTWGQEGYIWMSRNRDNNCGIASAASYPTISSASKDVEAATTHKATTSTTHKPATTSHSIATATHGGSTAGSGTHGGSNTQTQSTYSAGLKDAMYKPIGGKGFKPAKDQAAKFNF